MLSLWIPELPFQLAAGRDKSLAGRPLAFLSPYGLTPTLWLVNRLAKKEGIGTGEAMDRAIRSCPGLQVLDPAPLAWREAQASLGEFLAKLAPQGKLGRIGEALVEVDELGSNAKDAANTILKELLGSMGWKGHGGISSSGTASLVAARQEHGIESVLEGQEANYLAPHPLSAIPNLEKGILYRLNKLGLFEIRDIQPVPLDMLSQFLPLENARGILQCARGEDRPKLPMLAEKPHNHQVWRLKPRLSKRRRRTRTSS